MRKWVESLNNTTEVLLSHIIAMLTILMFQQCQFDSL